MKKLVRILFTLVPLLLILPSAPPATAGIVVDLSDIANGSARRDGTGAFAEFPPLADGALTVSYNGYTDIQAVYEFALPVELAGSELTDSTLTLRFVGEEGMRTVELLGYSADGVFSVADISDNQSVMVVDSVNFDFTGGTGTPVVAFDVRNFLQQLADVGASHAGFLLRERPAPGGNPSFMRVRTGAEDGTPAVSIDFEAGALQVLIDVKPGGEPNCFNINGHGTIPVAIFGSADFDVSDIDTASDAARPLSFNGLKVRVRGNIGPLCMPEYVNADAYEDMVCHFEDTASQWQAGSDQGTLTGQLLDGTSFEGVDAICVVP